MLDDGMPGLLGSVDRPLGGGGTQGPSLQFSVPCLEVSDERVDPETGATTSGPPSFKYVFYELPFPKFPFQFGESEGFYVANGWCNGLGDHRQRMKILDPARGEVVDTKDQPFTLKSREEPFMAVNYITNMRFEKPGTYYVQVYLDDRLALEYPLPVRQVKVQPQ